jgi:hypothetical protein
MPRPSRAHKATEGRLLHFGQSKDDPTRLQIKVMMGSLAPLEMPLSTDVRRVNTPMMTYTFRSERIRIGLENHLSVVCRRSEDEGVGNLCVNGHGSLELRGVRKASRVSWNRFSTRMAAVKRSSRPRGMS